MRDFGSLAAVVLVTVVGLAQPAFAGQMLPPGVSPDTLSAEPALVRLDPQPIAFVRLKTVRNTSAGSSTAAAGDIVFGIVGGGEAAQAAHRGDHRQIKRTHERIRAFITAGGRSARGKVVEQHFDNPHKVRAEGLRSAVTYFVD
jgi:hypothetical protein